MIVYVEENFTANRPVCCRGRACPAPEVGAIEINLMWSAGFMDNFLDLDPRFCLSNAIDDINWEGLFIEVDTSLLPACAAQAHGIFIDRILYNTRKMLGMGIEYRAIGRGIKD